MKEFPCYCRLCRIERDRKAKRLFFILLPLAILAAAVLIYTFFPNAYRYE